MGFLSSLGKAIEKPFRTGASKARKNAQKEAAAAQDQYGELLEFNKDVYRDIKPGILRGMNAQRDLKSYMSPEGMAGLYGDFMSGLSDGFDTLVTNGEPKYLNGRSYSGGVMTKGGGMTKPARRFMNPEYEEWTEKDTTIRDSILQPIINDRLDAAQHALGSAGLRRSGAAALEAAKVPTEVKTGFVSDMVRQVLSGLGNVSQLGIGYMGGGNAALQGMGGAIGGALNAANMGVNAQLGAAGQKGSMLGGLLSAGGSLGAAALLSDPDLKTNIRKIGEHGGLNVYQWDWKEGVKENLGDLVSMNVGFLSDEVREKFPHNVHRIEVGGVEFDVVDYHNTLLEIAA